MNCQELENLWIDYLDHALGDADQPRVEGHLQHCEKCAARVAEMRADLLLACAIPDIEPPARLIHKIIAETSGGAPAPAWYDFIFDIIRPQQLPKLAMGALMTVASLAVLIYASGVDLRNVTAADLTPTRLWESTNRQLHLAYSHGVKYYNALRIVYEIQTRLEGMNASVDQEKTTPAQPPQQSAPRPPAKTAAPRTLSEEHDGTHVLALNLNPMKKQGGFS